MAEKFVILPFSEYDDPVLDVINLKSGRSEIPSVFDQDVY